MSGEARIRKQVNEKMRNTRYDLQFVNAINWSQLIALYLIPAVAEAVREDETHD